MSKNFSPKTSPLNSVGVSIACVVITIIVITSTIKNVNEKLNYFEELKSSKWQESQTLITPYHQVKVTQYRDNSQRLVVSQNGYEIHIQFCDAKIKLVCNLVHKDKIKIESIAFYVKHQQNGFYGSHHLKTIIYTDLKQNLQIFHYDTELPNSHHKIYETLKKIWLNNLIIFFIFLFFFILTIAYLPHPFIKQNLTRKKISSLIIILTLGSYLYIITKTLIVSIRI